MKIICTLFAVGVIFMLAGYHFDAVELKLMAGVYLGVAGYITARYDRQAQNDFNRNFNNIRRYFGE